MTVNGSANGSRNPSDFCHVTRGLRACPTEIASYSINVLSGLNFKMLNALFISFIVYSVLRSLFKLALQVGF